MQYDLTDKLILITGTTSGIGRELVLTCASYGATVIALGKNKKKLQELYDEITELQLTPPILLPFNLAGATPKDYEDIAYNIGKDYGKLDGLVHNAATLGIKTELIHYDILKWYETIQVNLNAPFLMTKTLMPLLKLAKKASIIFTAANEGISGQAYQGAYGVSKAAITNFMQILAKECETHTNIRVNAINPGKIYSKMYTLNYPATNPDLMKHPKDIMPLYLKLLGDFSVNIHGEVISYHN